MYALHVINLEFTGTSLQILQQYIFAVATIFFCSFNIVFLEKEQMQLRRLLFYSKKANLTTNILT